MFEKLQNWFAEKVMVLVVKKILDKIPANGKKTIIGIVILVLGLLASAVPETAPFIGPVLEVLKGFEYQIVELSGLAIAIVGVIHKWLKEKEKNE